MSIVADQRKRNANQSRANVASQNNQQSQQNSKRGNKQPNNQNQAQNQTAAKSNPPTTASASTSTTAPASAPVPLPLPTLPAQTNETHVSLTGFNSDEVDKLLKNGYDEKALVYKPEQPTTQQKSSPWGQKPSSMSNGKDFWVELRKQVAILQKGESTNKGG